MSISLLNITSNEVDHARMGSSTVPKTQLSKQLLKIYDTLYSSFGPQHWWPGDTAFEIMIGAILTQNTSWQNVSKAIKEIKKAGLLDPKRLLKHRTSIPKLIRSSGFYNVKSRRLITFLNFFTKKYSGDSKKMEKKKIGILRDELLALPGIGHETADSILLYALSLPIFVIDAYTRRIFSRHYFFEYDRPYDEIRYFFENNLPPSTKLYNEYHALLVRLGKEHCKKNEPLCDTCPIKNILP